MTSTEDGKREQIGAVECGMRDDLQRWRAYQLTGRAINHETAAVWLTALAAGEISPRPGN